VPKNGVFGLDTHNMALFRGPTEMVGHPIVLVVTSDVTCVEECLLRAPACNLLSSQSKRHFRDALFISQMACWRLLVTATSSNFVMIALRLLVDTTFLSCSVTRNLMLKLQREVSGHVMMWSGTADKIGNNSLLYTRWFKYDRD
jgi:hypothetical protein